MLTEIQYKALLAISKGTYHHGVNAKALAWTLWGDNPKYEYLFTAASTQGNGATRGKKAWLCAGSLAGKLSKSGFVQHDRDFTGYHLTEYGEKALREYQKQHQITQKL